jgi:hypothetical protein
MTWEQRRAKRQVRKILRMHERALTRLLRDRLDCYPDYPYLARSMEPRIDELGKEIRSIRELLERM